MAFKKAPVNSNSQIKRHFNPYSRLGIILALSGAITAPVFYFIADSVPLTAVSLSAVILGLVSAVLGNARPDITPEASQMMLQTGMENIAALLEELGLTTRAVYIPAPENGGRVKALVPLKEDNSFSEIRGIVPERLITRCGPNLENMCLMVTTPGAISLNDVTVTRGGGYEQIEGALNQSLIGIMDLADSVSIHWLGKSMLADITRPKLKYENIWYYRCLGSPIASIVAAVTSQAMAKPVRIKGETELNKNVVRVELEILA